MAGTSLLAMLALALLSGGDAVVPPGEDLLGRTIDDVVVEGIDPEGVEGLDGLAGRPLTRPLVRDLLRTLWSSDRYRDVRVSAQAVAGGVRLVVRLDLRRRIRTFEATGNDHLDLRDMRRVAGFVPDSEEHPDLLNEMRGRIEAAYAERGYPNALVEFETEETGDPGRIAITAVVDEGEPVRVASIRFAGNLALPEPDVREAYGVEAGDPWDRGAIAEGAETLRRFYRDAEYLLAVVEEPIATARDDGGIDLVVMVEAGEPVRVVFGGNEHVPPGELALLVGLDEDPDLTPAGLGNACDRIVERYRMLGFPDAACTWSAEPTPEDARAGEPLAGPPEEPFGTLGVPWEAPEPPPPPPQNDLRFRIDEGPRLRVAAIAWRGNAHMTDDDLDDVVEQFVDATIDAPALLQPFPPGELGSLGISGENRLEASGRLPPRLAAWDADEIYVEQAYLDAAIQIGQRYRTEGFLDARVALRPPERDAAAGTITPVFEIVEGPQTMLRSMTVEGNEAIATGDIEDVFRVDADEPLNELLVEETRRAVVDLYASQGYLFVTVETAAEFTPDRTLADVSYVVVEGPQVRVQAIEVTGNEETETGLILGTLAFEEGDVFSPDLARTSEQRLLRMGIFQGVTIAPAAPDVVEPDKTILVQVRERPPQALELRAGFSTSEGVRGAFGYDYRNLFGYAIAFHLQLKLNYQFFFIGNDDYERTFDSLSLQDQLERAIVAGINVPYLPNIGGLLALQLDFGNERDNQPYYGIDRTRAFLGLSTGYEKLLQVQLQAGIEYNDVAHFGTLPAVCTVDTPEGEPCLSPTDSRRLRTPQGESTFGVIRTTVSVDWRDNPFSPTQGIFASATAEWVRSFSPVDDPATEHLEQDFSDLIKASLLVSGYVPLVSEMVLALSARYGQVFHLSDGSITFPDRYFYLGGFDSIRGFPQESVSVGDAPANSPSPGGDVFLIFRAEFRFPLTDDLSGALFADMGNLWRDPANIDLTNLRYAAGAGIRLGTPVGPLTFDYGFNLAPRDDWGEEFGALHFSIGMF